MNEGIKSSAKYSNKYHNYLPNSRPLSRHDISTPALTSRILVSVIPSRSQFSLTDDAGVGVGAWLGPRRGSGPLLSISSDQLSRANTTSSQFQETLLRTLPWLMSNALPIVMTVTQQFMMFLWVIPLAINENFVSSCKEMAFNFVPSFYELG